MASPVDVIGPWRSGIARVVVLVAAVALFAGGLAGLRIVKTPLHAQDLVDRARAFLDEQKSVHFEGTVGATLSMSADEAGPSTSVTVKGTISGDVLRGTGMAMTAVDDGGNGVHQSLLIGTTSYWRQAIDTGALAKTLWVRNEIGDDEDLTLGPIPSGDPLSMLDDIRSPRIVGRLEDTTKIRGALKRGGLEAGTSATVDVVVADNGELRLLGVRAAGKGGKSSLVMRFSDWGATVALRAPATNQIDATPQLDEEEVLAWKGAPLYMPRHVPKGWVLDSADVVPEEETAEGCEQVEIDLVSLEYFEGDDNAPYMVLYQLPTSCAGPIEGIGVKPFQAGSFVGGAYTDRNGLSYVQVRLDGRTTMQVESTLSLAQLQVVLADLVPLDFTRFSAAPPESQSA